MRQDVQPHARLIACDANFTAFPSQHRQPPPRTRSRPVARAVLGGGRGSARNGGWRPAMSTPIRRLRRRTGPVRRAALDRALPPCTAGTRVPWALGTWTHLAARGGRRREGRLEGAPGAVRVMASCGQPNRLDGQAVSRVREGYVGQRERAMARDDVQSEDIARVSTHERPDDAPAPGFSR